MILGKWGDKTGVDHVIRTIAVADREMMMITIADQALTGSGSFLIHQPTLLSWVMMDNALERDWYRILNGRNG